MLIDRETADYYFEEYKDYRPFNNTYLLFAKKIYDIVGKNIATSNSALTSNKLAESDTK